MSNDLVTISGSTFAGYTADWGGAIFDAGDILTVTNSTFVGNHADELGGAIYMYNGSVTQSTFLDNTTIDTADGGSIFTSGPQTVRGNIFAATTTQQQQLAEADPTHVVDEGGNVF